MIIILDNGQKYTQHEIRFVDIGSLPMEPAMELLLRFTHDNNSTDEFTPFIMAVVEKVEWRSEESLTPIASLWEKISEHLCMVGRCRDKEIVALSEHQFPYDVFKAREAEINARPWTPGEYACTCVCGELYTLAQKGKS